MERAGRCVREHRARLVREADDDRVERPVALLDPLEGRLEELAGVQRARGDRRGLLAQGEVLRVAHSGPVGNRADGALLGSRSGSGHTLVRSAADERAQLLAVYPICDTHHRKLRLVDFVAENLQACAYMLFEGVDWRSVTAAPTTPSC